MSTMIWRELAVGGQRQCLVRGQVDRSCTPSNAVVSSSGVLPTALAMMALALSRVLARGRLHRLFPNLHERLHRRRVLLGERTAHHQARPRSGQDLRRR